MSSKFTETEPAQAAPDPALEGWYLIHSYKGDDPLRSVMEQGSREEIIKLMEATQPFRGIGEADENGNRDQSVYYDLRQASEEWLKEKSGIAPEKGTPAFFAFTNDPDKIIEAMRQRGDSTLVVIPANAAPDAQVTITPGDSIGNMLFTMGYQENGKTPFIMDDARLLGEVMTMKEFVEAHEKGLVRDAEGQYWSKSLPPETVTIKPGEQAPVFGKKDAGADEYGRDAVSKPATIAPSSPAATDNAGPKRAKPTGP